MPTHENTQVVTDWPWRAAGAHSDAFGSTRALLSHTSFPQPGDGHYEELSLFAKIIAWWFRMQICLMSSVKC